MHVSYLIVHAPAISGLQLLMRIAELLRAAASIPKGMSGAKELKIWNRTYLSANEEIIIIPVGMKNHSKDMILENNNNETLNFAT